MSIAAVIMARKVKPLDPARLPLRGLCLLVNAPQSPIGQGEPLRTGGNRPSFPQRPNPQTLSETIPLYFITRNKNGFWIAREAEGRIGGMFVLQRSALRFAKKISAPIGCATMFLPQRLELDIVNRGSKIAAWLNAAVGKLGSLVPDHPPTISIRREIFSGDRG